MRCPQCRENCESEIVSRVRSDRRSRRCKLCGFRFDTVELPAVRAAFLESISSELSRALRSNNSQIVADLISVYRCRVRSMRAIELTRKGK